MARSTNQNLKRLQTLADVADKNIFERIDLAAKVLADLDWVAENHENEDKARSWLESQFFNQLAGVFSLGKLFQIYEQFPDEKQWAEYRYDLPAMHSLWRERQSDDGGLTGTRTAWKPIAEEFKARCEELESENASLKLQVAELTHKNAVLEGRLAERRRDEDAA